MMTSVCLACELLTISLTNSVSCDSHDLNLQKNMLQMIWGLYKSGKLVCSLLDFPYCLFLKKGVNKGFSSPLVLGEMIGTY